MADDVKRDLKIPLALLKHIEGSNSGNDQDDKNSNAGRAHIPFGGKLITSDDKLMIGQNFSALENMRYTDKGIKTIGGMSKINSSAMDATYIKTRSAFHLKKSQPAETHVIAQAYNSGLTASVILENKTAIGSTGDFEATELFTETTVANGAGIGQFSDATESQVCYCNGVDTLIWGGEEIRCARFLNIDPASPSTFLYDYTDHVGNTKTDTNNIAILHKVTTVATVYIGSLRPIKGVKLYVGTANTGGGSTACSYWSGTAWQAVSNISDGTTVLSSTGTISFDSTVSVAKVKYVDGTLLYYYKLDFTGIDDNVTIYMCTLDAPMQSIVDIWDGVDRSVGMFYLYTTAYVDYTLNIYTDTYDSGDVSTFVEVDSLPGNTGFMLLGFPERMTALNIYMVPNSVNTATATMTISYYNGSGFTSVGTITDGTATSGVPLAQSGTVSWDSPSPSSEFKYSISNGVPLYYYKISFGAITLSTDVQIYHITGIPAQEIIRNFKFSILTQNRLMLCNNTDWKKNLVKFAASDTSQVFNGDDSGEFEFGDETPLLCGCSLFSQFGSNLYNFSLLFKENEIWVLVWQNDTWIRYKISETIGCPAPGTLCTTIIPPNEKVGSLNRYVAIWQGTGGIYMSDGRAPVLISEDISDVFDRTVSDSINTAMLDKSNGFIDESRAEYHWLYASGSSTTLDKERVFDLKRWKWYTINRTSGNELQCGISVYDTYGNPYKYGFIDTGYMEALEWLNSSDGPIKTFDGVDITSVVELGDISLIEKDMFTETQITTITLVMKAKTETDDVTLTHYADGSNTGTDYTMDMNNSGYRIAMPIKKSNEAPSIFHSFKFTVSTGEESVGFEPLLFGVLFDRIRTRNYE